MLKGLALLALLTACDPGETVLETPESPSTPNVSIRAVMDTSYGALAAALGWTAGIPRADVRVHLMAEPYDSGYWRVSTTDSVGGATFAGLPYGLYEVEVTRALMEQEIAHADRPLTLVAGGQRLQLPADKPQDVAVGPDRRGSLVFSEVEMNTPDQSQTGGDGYSGATYFEVYNNSDSTVYLDGKYYGMSWNLNSDYSTTPCAQTVVVRNDPDGVWTQWIVRFPGRGTDYPLAPGQVALIAESAIDHRAILPTLPDLSRADFERGGPYADNPQVPNLQDIGPGRVRSLLDTEPLFLSEPVDLGVLPRYVDPWSGHVYVRIPGTKVLDVQAYTADWTTWNYKAVPACLEETYRSFERLPGPAAARSDFDNALSLQRQVLTVLPDGRKLLQDTNTSMLDFVKAPRTPGWIPDSLP